MNGQPKMRYESSRGESMFDPLSAAEREQFTHGQYEQILAHIQALPQQSQRERIRAYTLAATEAMTEAYNLGNVAGSAQEAEAYRARHDELEKFYEQLMRLNRSNEE